MTPRVRQPVQQHVLTVESTDWLGPHLVRVHLTGDSLAAFPENGCTDSYVKLYFVDPALGLEPPYDLAGMRETLSPDQRPVMRTYTVRQVDRDARRLAIDFVTHGDTGVAAPWAAAVRRPAAAQPLRSAALRVRPAGPPQGRDHPDPRDHRAGGVRYRGALRVGEPAR